MATASRRRLPLRLRPLSLQTLLLLSHLGLTAPVLVLLTLWSGYSMQAAALDQAARELDGRATALAPLLREPLKERLRGALAVITLVKGYSESIGATVTVLDPFGRVLISSDERISTGAQLVGAELQERVTAVRYDAALGEERLYAAAPIIEDVRQVVGFVQVSRPAAPLWRRVQGTWLTLGGAAAGALVLAVAGSLLVAREITRPVRALTRAAQAVAGGDLNRVVEPSGPSETQRLADAFNRMSATVRETLAQQEAFVANAAHELRSPLASIKLRLEMIDAHGREHPEMAAEYLAKLQGEVSSLQHLIDELLSLSVVGTRESAGTALVDLAPLCYTLSDQYGPLAQRAGLTLDVEVPDHLLPVAVNEAQMAMAVSNLLSNAVKFTPPGGRVTLAAGVVGRYVEVRVSDTGRGISPEALPHVFERFYREDRSDHRGAGLGLSLVKAVVEAHGGTVTAQSRVGEGSSFTVRLPLA